MVRTMKSHIIKAPIQEAKHLQEIIVITTIIKDVCKGFIKMLSLHIVVCVPPLDIIAQEITGNIHEKLSFKWSFGFRQLE